MDMKTKMFNSKKILSLFLALIMMLSYVPTTAFAADIYTVQYNLTNLTTNGPDSISNQDLCITLVPEEGYLLPETITVTMDDENITLGADPNTCTYDSETGYVIKYWGSITDNIVITAAGVQDPAFSGETEEVARIMPGTSGISGYDSTNGYDHIYMGYWTAPDSYTTSSPIKWRVLDDQTNTGASGLFLLSDVLLGTGINGDVYFDNNGSNVWQNSTAQAWCKDFAGEEGAATNVTDAFTADELGAVLATTKSDQEHIHPLFVFSASENILNGDKVFFLSAEEAVNEAYGFSENASRVANYGTSEKLWWLRSPCTNYGFDYAGAIYYDGYVDYDLPDYVLAARPAFNLDLNAVLFTSAAVGGKQGTTGSINEISSSNTTEWKLTLKDSSRSDFTAETTRKNGDTLTVSYSGATTGANEYISVMIADSTGAYTHYGRIKNITEAANASGTVEINLSGIDMTGKTLYVFNEQYNGGANDDTKLTDYASSFVNVPLAVTGIINVSTLSSDLIITAIGYSMNGKTYLYEGDYTLTGTTSHGVIFEAGEYQLTANDLTIVKGDTYSGSAIELKNGAALHLVLTGDNTLTGGWEGSGIRVNEGTSLTISGDGILRAGYQQGGNAAYGAAIGGYCNSNFGTITINGGTIYATGGGGASIGSGNLYGSSNTMAGTIALNGGTIYADLIGNARSSGAVLKGSGAKVYCNSVRADTSGLNEIVYSKDGTSATYYCNDFIVTGDVANCSWDQTNKVLNINGGTVTVSNADKNAATSHRIYIQGTANVTLDGVNITTTTGAPIEIRDYNDTNVTLTLSGNNTLISQTANKAAIHKTRGQQATSSDAATLTINGSGSLTAVGGNNAAGIGGGGHRGDTHNIIINSGTISATGKGWAAGIGSSNDGSTWNITINGGNITASGAPGIGANTDNWQGVKDASITGGMVTTNSYKGSTPTGGLVSTDGGKTFTVYSDYTLSQDLTIATDGKMTVAEGTKLTIADGFTLTNKGVIVNDGTISGNLVNEGTIYNKGTLPANVGGTVYEQYVKVNNGSGTGNYTEGSTVSITADAPASGMMFTGWTIELGTITLTDSTKAETTFTMPEGCVIVKANYADIVATITDSNGNVQYYSDGFRAQEDWTRNGGTLTVHSDDFRLEYMDAPDGSVLDLNGHSVEPMMLHIRNSCTIQNGTISMWHEGIVEEDAVVTFKNVTITNDEHGSWEVEITNDGTIIDEGLTLNGVIISGAAVKTGLTEDRVTLSGIPTEGYVYDGTAHEPGVKCGETTLVAGTDYTVTFSNSSGGDSTVNAGTITMTITGIGNYAGTVTKTYTIGKATLTVTAENKEITYGDAVPNYTVTYSGLKDNDTAEDLGGRLSFACDYAQFSNKGTYTITPSGFESGNYEISYVPGTLTVNPKAITVTIANKTSVYGKAIAELTATDNGIVNNDTNVYSLTTTATGTANVGTYPITGTALDANYDIIFVDGTYTITKAQAVGTSPTAVSGLVYNKSAQTLIAAGSTNDGTMVYSLEKEGEYTSELPQATAAGTYYVWYKVIGDGNHSDSAPVSAEVKIDKADPSIGAVTAGVVNDTLETSAIVLTRTNTNVAGNLIVDAGQTLVLGENEIAYTFVPTDSNYKAVTGTVTVTVVDTIAPTGTVTLATNNWTKFLNNITFGLFFEETQTVSVVASDNLSGVAKIEYIESKTAMDLDAVKAATQWTEMDSGSISVTLEDTKQFVYYIRITDKSGNVSYLSSDGAEYDTSAPVIAGVNNGVTYYTSQTVTVTDKNIDTVTLNGEPANVSITLKDDKEATYTIVATDKAGNSTTVIVKMVPIADITESMEGMTSENVTSDDKAALQTIVDTVTELLKDEELPTEEKEALEKIKADAEALLKVIEDADKAADTENTDKVEGVTADNVTPDDKADLEKAKADLEKALEDNGGNYTAEEKKAIEDELKRIEDALKVIENVEAVEDAISNLPATMEPDDEETVAKIEAAKKSYNELTDYEKSLVNPEAKEKLDKLTNGIVAYDIVKGDGSSWAKGTDGSITFTVNGPISKFSGIKVDGKAVDAQHYDVKAGSTIITLKASYLETLAAGEHSITVVYTDGETSGTFNVQAKPTVPATGDNSNMFLWISLLFISDGAVIALTVVDRRRKVAKR